MIAQLKNWLRAWKSRRRDVWVDGHFRSLPARKPQKAKEETKSLTINTTKEFLMSIDVDGTMATIADERVAKALQVLRSEQEAKSEASLLQMEGNCSRA